jgi:hypothetical protein
MTTEVLDQVDAELKAQNKARAAEFRKLAAAIASGDEMSPESITATLEATGRTIDDLRRQVDLVRKRRELRRTVDSEPGLIERQAELRRAIAVADAELKLAEDRHEEAVEPFAIELDQVADGLRRANEAKATLWELLDAGSKSKLERMTRRAEAQKVAAREARSLAEALATEALHVAEKTRTTLSGLAMTTDAHSRRGLAQAAEQRMTAARAAAERSRQAAVEAQRQADALVAELRSAELAAVS